MGKAVDLTGKRFGKLTAICYTYTANKKRYWECKCDCGKVINAVAGSLVTGNTQSCGCQRAESIAQVHTTHGYSKTPLYRAWKGMKRRCDNPKAFYYERYGGRGITYHSSFETFEGFLAGIPDGYREGLELDRIDNDGNYEPGNLKWSTRREQMNNMSRNRNLTLPDGRVLTLAAIAREYGMRVGTLAMRINLGWDVARAISEPVMSSTLRRLIFSAHYSGSTISEIASKFSVSEDTLRQLLCNNAL